MLSIALASNKENTKNYNLQSYENIVSLQLQTELIYIGSRKRNCGKVFITFVLITMT